MKVALIAKDKPGALQIRKDTREAHLAYLKSSDTAVKAGPLLNAQGEMCGSLIVLEVADLAEAQAWADGDPYAAAGLFDSVELIQWNQVIGT